MTFNEELKEKRLELGYSQKQMAEYLGLSLSTYRNLENYIGGYNYTLPSYQTVAALKKAGIVDYTFKEFKTRLELDRKQIFRKSHGNRYPKKESE